MRKNWEHGVKVFKLVFVGSGVACNFHEYASKRKFEKKEKLG